MDSENAWTVTNKDIQGMKWFCPRCGIGILVTSEPVPGLLLEKDGKVHKHDGSPFLAGYLDGKEEGTQKALDYAKLLEEIDE